MNSPQSKGGHARAQALSADQRSNIARRAAAARWDNPRPKAPTIMDGLPAPIRREVHTESINKSSGQVQIRVIEVEHPTFILMTASVTKPSFAFAQADRLAGLVAQRIEQGWKLQTLTDSSATLVR